MMNRNKRIIALLVVAFFGEISAMKRNNQWDYNERNTRQKTYHNIHGTIIPSAFPPMGDSDHVPNDDEFRFDTRIPDQLISIHPTLPCMHGRTGDRNELKISPAECKQREDAAQIY